MSKILSIEDLRKEFLAKKDSPEFIDKLQLRLEELVVENNRLKEELLSKGSIFSKEVTPEQIICIEQIKILQQQSKNRELALDEVKKFDILNKSLRLIRNQATENVNPTYRDVSEDDLLKIALNKN